MENQQYFVILLTYKVPIDDIDHARNEHVAFLDKYYDAGVFIVSGPKVPRSGGVILAKGLSKAAMFDLIKEDPFYQKNLADYEIIEFLPSKMCYGLKNT
ncbi:MAG: hypothetical protein HEEMFOPI_00898 [Holosporales bacterium]